MRLAAACVALGFIAGMNAGSAHAQAKGPSVQSIEARMNLDPEVEYATKMSELDAWLRRLPGRYVTADQRTRVDCIGVGSGPGVRCVSRYVWSDLGPDTPGPAFTLYGIDPDLPGIRTLKVSGLSIADHDEAGTLKGNTVTFQSACPLPVHVPGQQATPVRCEHQIRIFAPPDSDSVLLSVRTDMTMIVPPPPKRGDGGTSQKYERIKTFTSYSDSEWQRLADDDTSEPVLQLQAVALDSLEQYGKAVLPELVGHIADQAGSLAPAQLAELEKQLAAFESRSSHRILVVTVNALGNQSIEAFVRQAAQTWQLGGDDRSDYILVAVAPNEGKARIGSGAGMRACMPDATAQRILEEVMVPEFQYQRFSDGITKGVASLMTACREPQATTVAQ